MTGPIDTRRIAIFLLFAFGIAWATGLVIYLTGGLENSPQIVPGLPLSLVLLATAYMCAPALAHVLTRLVTREGWRELQLQPNLRRSWPYWLAAWFVPVIATVAGAALFFALFPGFFDPTLGAVRDLLAQSGQPLPVDPWLIVAAQAAAGVLLAPLVNGLFTFGEEFGWRAYLLPRLLPLGARRATLIVGIIWGMWHWPVIAMGYEYGFDYPGYPWTGFLLFVWFAVVLSVFFTWLTVRSGSVWPAVIGHAAVNGISALPVLFVQGEPSPLLGPLPIGLIGMAGWLLVALVILLRWRVPVPEPISTSM